MPTHRNDRHHDMTVLLEALEKLDTDEFPEAWNAFTEAVSLPNDLLIPLMTGRPELLKLAVPRPLTVEECYQVYKLIGVLLHTNALLQKHAAATAHLVKTWGQAFTQLESVGRKIEHFANFQRVLEGEDNE